MRWVRAGLVVLLGVWMTPLWAAEQVNETWRSPLGTPTSVAVDPADGSLWATTGASLMHISATGSTLLQVDGFYTPRSVAVSPKDGSVWVVEAGVPGVTSGEEGGPAVFHLSSAGAVLTKDTGFNRPWALAMNDSDGSVWVGDLDGFVSHLSANDEEQWRGGSFNAIVSLAVNPKDGSVWVADEGIYDESKDTYEGSAIVHLSSTGTELLRSQAGTFNAPESVALDTADGSVWVADYYNSQVKHISAGGLVLWTGTGFCGPFAVAVDSEDGSVWVADTCYGEVTHWSSTGSRLWLGDPSSAGFWTPYALAVDQVDGSCWVADAGTDELIHVGANHTVPWRQAGIGSPVAVAQDWIDGSTWVATGPEVVHVASDGQVLSRSTGFVWATSVSVNLTDGSCWVADAGSYDCDSDQNTDGLVVHLDRNGNLVWQGGGLPTPSVVSVNSNDGTVWVLDMGTCLGVDSEVAFANPVVVHLAANGAELWRKTGLSEPTGVSVYPADGSCWVTDWTDAGGDVYRFRSDGSVAWQSSAFAGPIAVAADPGDGSAWIGDTGAPGGTAVVHLSSTGTELGRAKGFWSPSALSPNPMDGTCWVADSMVGVVSHLDGNGTVRWTNSLLYPMPGGVAADPYTGECWVADTLNDQLAVLTPTSYVTPTEFWDVPVTQWAAPSIEACVAGKIVSGYPNGGYRPGNPVTRDQMAVYVARALSGGDSHVPSGPGAASFSDVPTDYWAFKYVEYAKAKKVVTGYSDNTYRPANAVTRDQMAVYIARSVVNPTGDEGLAGYTPPATASFADVPLDSWAYKYIEYAKAQSIVQGYSDGYRPAVVVTRDQMAVYVARAFKLLP